MKYNYSAQFCVYAIPAGVFIGIGGAANCLSGNPVVGAVFFSVGLFAICSLQMGLVTGKAGYITSNASRQYVLYLLTLCAGNCFGATICGGLVRLASPSVIETAVNITNARMAQSVWQTLSSAFLCGVLVHFAVQKSVYPLGIFFAVPTFILCGFEHCVADMFYFSAANEFGLAAIWHIALVIAGNVAGAAWLNTCIDLKKLSRPLL